MKKTLLILAFALVQLTTLAQQAPALQWQKSFGVTSSQYDYSSRTTPSGCTSGNVYPMATYTPLNNGNNEIITNCAYAYEYTNVNILTGNDYMFSSSLSSDYITITDSSGTIIYTSGTTPVSWQSGTVSGTIRYYIHTNSNCGSGASCRTRYIKNVSTPCLTATPTASSQSFCSDATVANLVATGTSLNWYNVASGGTALSSTIALSTGTYYVTQTIGCESTSLSVNVTVTANVSPTFTQVAPICAGASLSALPTTSNNGLTGTWSPPLNNTATTTYTFTPTAGLCLKTATMTITVNPTSAAGTASAVATICSGNATSVSLSGSTGTIQWQKSNAVNTAWSVINGVTSAILNTDVMTASTYFRAVVTSGVCSSVTSNSVTVSVITTPAPTAAAQTVPSTATVANLVATGTNLKWYTTASGGIALATTTVLVQGNYYVSQTLNGCESSVRALSAVTLYVIPVSKVITSQCGSTLTSIDANINAEIITGYQAYRFEVTNGTTVKTIELNKYNFSLTQTPGIVYNTTYSVRVAVKIGNVWGAYGAPCSITTPLNASVSIVPVLATGTCGSTLLSVSQSIYAETIFGATSYRFKVNGSEVIETSNRYFSLNSITGGVLFGTAYTIAVSCFVNGTWTSFGTACNVNTPGVAVVGTQMVLCGQTVTVLRQSIYATSVDGASKYRFRVNGNQVIETANRYFNLTQVGAVLGASYSIEVACFMSGISWTPYGTACTIYTPNPSARELETATSSIFNVTASPNPYNTAFKLTVSEPTEETIFVSVYDMMGKHLEKREINASEIENVLLGQEYASGIYIVLVAQGTNSKTVRLVKN